MSVSLPETNDSALLKVGINGNTDGHFDTFTVDQQIG
jgi:hypothetical protein